MSEANVLELHMCYCIRHSRKAALLRKFCKVRFRIQTRNVKHWRQYLQKQRETSWMNCTSSSSGDTVKVFGLFLLMISLVGETPCLWSNRVNGPTWVESRCVSILSGHPKISVVHFIFIIFSAYFGRMQTRNCKTSWGGSGKIKDLKGRNKKHQRRQ